MIAALPEAELQPSVLMNIDEFGDKSGQSRIDGNVHGIRGWVMDIQLQSALKFIPAALVAYGSFGLAWSFDLSPQGTQLERDAIKSMSDSRWDKWLSALMEADLPKFKIPVHEELTNRAFGCTYEGPNMCSSPDGSFATTYVMAGVRWNDDPPFQLNAGQATVYPKCKVMYADGRLATIRVISQPVCWASMFVNAKSQLKKNSETKFDPSTQAALPIRSHFGDLQYLHAMAVANGEPAAVTQGRILGWAQFTWGVMSGDYKIDTWLKDVDIPLVKESFGNSTWRVQDLFALGNPSLRDNVGDVAFGSLLHAVQDSFSRAHVDRMDPPPADTKCPGSVENMPGPIREFHSYGGQDAERHAAADTRDAFANSGVSTGPVEVGQAMKRFKKSGAKWADVELYFRCVFQLAPGAQNATSGGF